VIDAVAPRELAELEQLVVAHPTGVGGGDADAAPHLALPRRRETPDHRGDAARRGALAPPQAAPDAGVEELPRVGRQRRRRLAAAVEPAPQVEDAVVEAEPVGQAP